MTVGLNIGNTREALKATIVKAGLARDIAIHAYDPYLEAEAHHQFPAIVISIADNGIEYRRTMGAHGIASLTLLLEIRTQDGPDGERVMDDLLNAGTGTSSSLFDAIASDPTLGGVVADAVALSVTSPRRMSNGTTTFWSARMALTVTQPRS